jgi:hypothetical protein
LFFLFCCFFFANTFCSGFFFRSVIQHVLEKGKAADKSLITAKVRGQVLQMSKHKFASNVVEKCVTFGTKQDRQLLIDEVITVKADGTSPLVVMMKDQFANVCVE